MKLLILLSTLILSFEVLAQDEVNAVIEGRKSFETFGCMVCHATTENDKSVRSGPNLYGLFQNTPRSREVLSSASGIKVSVKADKAYYINSVRKSWDVLAIHEVGSSRGQAFPKVMPMYSKEVIPDQHVEFIWHYLRTLSPASKAGPKVVKIKANKGAEPKTLLDIRNEIVVTDRARVIRAPLRGSSGRAMHVGFPNGMNYTFDPRVLSVRNVWAGGFLNLSQERSGRGRPGSARGQGNKVYFEGKGLLQPILASGESVDFEFKEPDVMDHKAIEKWLWEDRDFSELLSSTDAEYGGHRLRSSDSVPVFNFRVGKNKISQSIELTDDGLIVIELSSELVEDQKFKISKDGLTDINVSGGKLSDDQWLISANDGEKISKFIFKAKLNGGLIARPIIGNKEDWSQQPVKKNSEKLGRQILEVPPGYSFENWEAPKDLYGRSQLFEPTGIAVAKDGTIVVATRSAGIWRIKEGKWSLFAEGLYEALGIIIEDEKGDRIVVMQKPELTRISDTNSDGRADLYETLCDDFGFHANYHEYAHGPARDNEGNYYFTLNLSHGGNERTSWRAGGPYMGSMGGYRGWACKVTPSGEFIPFANGLRSPAGIGFGPDGRLWYAENQGEYVGSSKVVPLEEGKFYGHLSGLVTLPGKMKPDSPELKFDNWKDKIRKGAVWLPHGKVANSPGHPAWDMTDGKFGPYNEHMFIGDQTMSNLFRVVVEKVNGQDQGCVVPFARFFASGVMRPVFLNDGSLLIGQTGRGWGAWGGQEGCLQRIIYDGKTESGEIFSVHAHKQGLEVRLTKSLNGTVEEKILTDVLKIESWYYTNTGRYGSPEHDKRQDKIEKIAISTDRKSFVISIAEFESAEKWLDRIYHLKVNGADKLFDKNSPKKDLTAYYTLRSVPK
ncbi:MAG: hypothetical protein ACJ0IB_04070 [Verrucomicrobiales bacterium]|nr:hypothetical protein [Verrucomicrobiales bacterium]